MSPKRKLTPISGKPLKLSDSPSLKSFDSARLTIKLNKLREMESRTVELLNLTSHNSRARSHVASMRRKIIVEIKQFEKQRREVRKRSN